MPAPEWATALVKRVADDYGVEAPTLVWRRSRGHYYSSGYHTISRIVKRPGAVYTVTGRDGRERRFEGWESQGETIVVTAGTEVADRRETVLHEMAHAIEHSRAGAATGHGPTFYALLGELVLRYGGTLKHLRDRESRNAKALKEGLRLMRQRRRAA